VSPITDTSAKNFSGSRARRRFSLRMARRNPRDA